MPESFDPYRKWLGIPAAEQPPHHYRLLAIHWFEDDPDVIEAAADRQMIHIRTYQTGKHAELSQKILNELSAARVCLLDPVKKAAYDTQLRARLAQESQAWEPKGPPFGFFVRGTAEYFAVQARRFWISQVQLARAHRALGQDVYNAERYRDRLAYLHDKLAAAETRANIEQPDDRTTDDEQQPADEKQVEGFSAKAKRLAGRMRTLLERGLAAYRRKRLLRRLGQAAYELEGQSSGPESITGPIAQALDQLDQLRSEVSRLSEVPPGQLLSGKRLAWLVIGILGFLVLVFLWLRWVL